VEPGGEEGHSWDIWVDGFNASAVVRPVCSCD
jgi:hypothetical protein